jgi:hypothetical protein
MSRGYPVGIEHLTRRGSMPSKLVTVPSRSYQLIGVCGVGEDYQNQGKWQTTDHRGFFLLIRVACEANVTSQI